jgi:hypothetical protein
MFTESVLLGKVKLDVPPMQQPSSSAPLQSSSHAFPQTSDPAQQAPQVHHGAVHVCVPPTKQALVQPETAPRLQAKVSSVAPLQSSSQPLHVSGVLAVQASHEHPVMQVWVPEHAPTVQGWVRPRMQE